MELRYETPTPRHVQKSDKDIPVNIPVEVYTGGEACEITQVTAGGDMHLGSSRANTVLLLHCSS